MKFFEKIEDQLIIKFDHGRLVLASIGAALFIALVFLMGVLVGKALWSHQPGSIVAARVEQARPPLVSDEPRVGASRLDFYADVKRPADEVAVPSEMKSRVLEEKPSPTPVVPTVPPPTLPVPTAPDQTASLGNVGESPAEPTPTVAPRAAAPAKSGFAVQVESYQEKGKAESAKKKLASKGVTTEISLSQVNGVNWYRLQAGGFSTREAAEKYYREVLKPKGLKGYIISR